MVEYLLLLASTTKADWLDRASGVLTDHPLPIAGGAVALVLLLGWVLKPDR
jgi:hypothetical protein